MGVPKLGEAVACPVVSVGCRLHYKQGHNYGILATTLALPPPFNNLTTISNTWFCKLSNHNASSGHFLTRLCRLCRFGSLNFCATWS